MAEPVVRNILYSLQEVANIILRQTRNEDSEGKGIFLDFPFTPISSHVSAPNISSSTLLTPPVNATKILWQALTANVRYTLDGSTPSASSGFQIKAGDPPFIVQLSSGISIRVIQEAGGADLEYEWGR